MLDLLIAEVGTEALSHCKCSSKMLYAVAPVAVPTFCEFEFFCTEKLSSFFFFLIDRWKMEGKVEFNQLENE